MRKGQQVRRGLFNEKPSAHTIDNALKKLIQGTNQTTQEITAESTIDAALEFTNEHINEHINEYTNEPTKQPTNISASCPNVPEIVEPSTSNSIKNNAIENTKESTNEATLEATTEIITEITIEYTNDPTQDIAMLAKWHTSAEQKVYEAMYWESRKERAENWYFTFGRLSESTGLRNPRTLQTAINGLIDKSSIEWVEGDPGSHFGKCYRIFEPTEILEKRRNKGIKIHPQTKRIFM